MKHLCPHHLELVVVGGRCYLVWFPFSAEVCRPAFSEGSSCFILAARLPGRRAARPAAVFALAASAAGSAGPTSAAGAAGASFLGVLALRVRTERSHSWVSVKPGRRVLQAPCCGGRLYGSWDTTFSPLSPVRRLVVLAASVEKQIPSTNKFFSQPGISVGKTPPSGDSTRARQPHLEEVARGWGGAVWSKGDAERL